MRNVGFTEFCRLVEAFGLKLRRVSGNHHIYRHPEVPRPLSLQPHQFLDMVEEHGLKMERRR
jgi:predicted RNA binding protein YcfA (HicA-like mRNA interferase family)